MELTRQSMHQAIARLGPQYWWRVCTLALFIMTIQLVAFAHIWSDQSGSAVKSVSVTPVLIPLASNTASLIATSPADILNKQKKVPVRRKRPVVWYLSAKGSECHRASRYRGKIPLPLVALLSTQGSGNTWLRWLLESLTGICTGSLYKERSMLQAGFQCELISVHSGRVIAYKVHHHHQVSENSSRVILLIRNPFDALVSDFNRVNTRGNHTALAEEIVFRTNEWHQFVIERSQDWLNQIQLALHGSQELLVVFYENLKSDLSRELLRLAEFLGVRANDFRVNCVVGNSEGVAKRASRTLPGLFTSQEREFVTYLIAQADTAFRKYDVENIPEFYTQATASLAVSV